MISKEVKTDYYVPHREPKLSFQDVKNLYLSSSEKSKLQKELERHNEFLEMHKEFKPYIRKTNMNFWYVPEDKLNKKGFPRIQFMPKLYDYLWYNYPVFFTEDGYWATDSKTVMKALGELWTHAEWRDRKVKRRIDRISKTKEDAVDAKYNKFFVEGVPSDKLELLEEIFKKKNNGKTDKDKYAQVKKKKSQKIQIPTEF